MKTTNHKNIWLRLAQKRLEAEKREIIRRLVKHATDMVRRRVLADLDPSE